MSGAVHNIDVLVAGVAKKTSSGADKRWYFRAVSDLIDFLSKEWGKADLVVPYPQPNGGNLTGKKGIILFEVTGWRDARGHATLWDGTICYDHCYFNEPGRNHRTDRANFWQLS